MIRHSILGCGLLMGLCITPLSAQQPAPGKASATARSAQQLRREALRVQLARLLPDTRERTAILARVDLLTDDEVQEMTTLCLDELELRRQQQFRALREANARERAFQEQLQRALPPPSPGPYFVSPYAVAPYRYGFGPAGFMPVITWLPEGVSLTAQAVVSPDRKHVRMTLMPFFSTIGPVYTFNYMTGETRLYDP